MAYVRKHPDVQYDKFRMKVGVMPDFSGSKFIPQEKPVGTKDGVNRIFQLSKAPLKDSEEIYKDGMFMVRATDDSFTDGDYIVDWLQGELTFSVEQTPVTKSVIIARYKHL